MPELRIYFHNGTFNDHAHLCSNEAIEARILSLRKPPRPTTPRGESTPPNIEHNHEGSFVYFTSTSYYS